jgi:hypothetical protein
MNGATIQERPCPRCANRRTVRIAGASFCHNCHLHWGHALGTALSPSQVQRPEPAYVFTAAEIARLEIYREAVSAGFFSDW